MIKRKSKALLCAIASIGFINSIEIIHANAYNNSFSDTKGHWAEAEISKFNDLGYISGYEDKTFKPNNSVTRAEFVKILNNVDYSSIDEKELIKSICVNLLNEHRKIVFQTLIDILYQTNLGKYVIPFFICFIKSKTTQ